MGYCCSTHLNLSAQNRLPLHPTLVRVIEITVEQQRGGVAKRQDLRVVAGAVPLMEGGRPDFNICKLGTVIRRHYHKGLRPMIGIITAAGLHENTRTRIAQERHPALQLTKPRQEKTDSPFF